MRKWHWREGGGTVLHSRHEMEARAKGWIMRVETALPGEGREGREEQGEERRYPKVRINEKATWKTIL